MVSVSQAVAGVLGRRYRDLNAGELLNVTMMKGRTTEEFETLAMSHVQNNTIMLKVIKS